MRQAGGARRPVPGGERIFQMIYTRLGCAGRPPHFVVEYHPYAGLTHTIRLREDTAHVRLSDVLAASAAGRSGSGRSNPAGASLSAAASGANCSKPTSNFRMRNPRAVNFC